MHGCRGDPFGRAGNHLLCARGRAGGRIGTALSLNLPGVTGSLTSKVERHGGFPAEHLVRHSFGLTESTRIRAQSWPENGSREARDVGSKSAECRLVIRIDWRRRSVEINANEVTRMSSAELIGIESADHSWAATRVEAIRLPGRCSEPGRLQGPVGWGSGAIQPSQLSGFARTT